MRSPVCARTRAIVRALRVERDALRRGSMFLISGRPVARTRYYRDTPTRTRPCPYGGSSVLMLEEYHVGKGGRKRGEKVVYTEASN